MPYKDPDKQREYGREYWRRLMRKRIVDAIKLTAGCIDCG